MLLKFLDVPPKEIQQVKEKLVRNGFEFYETPVGGHGIAVIDATTVTTSTGFLESKKDKLREIAEWKYFN